VSVDNVVIQPAAPSTREATRSRILDAADELFIEKGFHGTSVHEIAAAAGFTTGAIYSNFRGKDEIFLAVIDRRTAERMGDFERIALELIAVGTDAGRAIARSLICVAYPAPWTALVLEFLGRGLRDEKIREQAIAPFNLVVDAVRRILAAAGTKPAIPADRIAPLVMALIEGHLVVKALDAETCPDELFTDGLSLLLKEEPA
jgi:AcrR family transcriptional regulator